MSMVKLEITYESSRGYIYGSSDLKTGQNVCLDEISNEFEIGSLRFDHFGHKLDNWVKLVFSIQSEGLNMKNFYCLFSINYLVQVYFSH